MKVGTPESLSYLRYQKKEDLGDINKNAITEMLSDNVSMVNLLFICKQYSLRNSLSPTLVSETPGNSRFGIQEEEDRIPEQTFCFEELELFFCQVGKLFRCEFFTNVKCLAN